MTTRNAIFGAIGAGLVVAGVITAFVFLKRDVGGSHAEINGAQARIDSLEKTQADLKAQLEKSQRAISALEQQVKGLRTTTETISANYVSAASLHSLEEKMATAQNDAKGAVDKISGEHARTRAAVDQLASYVSSQLYPAVTRLDNDVKEVKQIEKERASTPTIPLAIGRLVPAADNAGTPGAASAAPNANSSTAAAAQSAPAPSQPQDSGPRVVVVDGAPVPTKK